VSNPPPEGAAASEVVLEAAPLVLLLLAAPFMLPLTAVGMVEAPAADVSPAPAAAAPAGIPDPAVPRAAGAACGKQTG
jgi:hypothetical protein